MSYQYSIECAFIKEKILEASKLLEVDFDVTEKMPRDVVTSNDLAIEKFLVEAIAQQFPEDIIISEESNQRIQEGHRLWVMDPIDGTTNYTRGIPMYGIQVAFVVDGAAELSAIYYRALDALYVAKKNYGAFCNDQPIHVGGNKTLDQAIISLGDFSTSNDFRNSRMLNLIRSLMNRVYKLKIHGSACVDMMFVASGKTDVHVMSAHYPWDYLPGLLLVHEAGGVVEKELIENFGLERTLMVVGSTVELYDEIQSLI